MIYVVVGVNKFEKCVVVGENLRAVLLTGGRIERQDNGVVGSEYWNVESVVTSNNQLAQVGVLEEQ
jgi:hypothetical protein